jgi:hypothetical protein
MIHSCKQYPNKENFKYINLKSVIFWNITQCSSSRTCRLHLHGRRISQARNQCEAGSYKYIPPKRRLPFSGPQRKQNRTGFAVLSPQAKYTD